MKEFAIPYEVTFRGTLFVEAETAEEAKQIAESGGWEDDSFTDRASIVNCEVFGKPKERAKRKGAKK